MAVLDTAIATNDGARNMRLALSTALLVIDSRPADAVGGLIEDFRTLDLPVIHAGGRSGSAFAGTALESTLEEQGVLTLIVCGEAPEATVRDALSLGFRVFATGDGAAIAEVAAALDVLKQRRA